VDAVILSAGVNNLFFGPLVEFCVINGLTHSIKACQDYHAYLTPYTGADAAPGDKMFVADTTSSTTINDLYTNPNNGLQVKLDGLYVPLATALSSPLSSGGLGVAKEHVIITQYPDFSHDGHGNTCDTATTPLACVPQWNTSAWTWFSAQSNVLNYHVGRTTSRGWQVAALPPLDPNDLNGFLYHGYCAGGFKLQPTNDLYSASTPWGGGPRYTLLPNFGESYFLGALEGIQAGDATGGFHPLAKGHNITKEAVMPILCDILYGNDACSGDPKD